MASNKEKVKDKNQNIHVAVRCRPLNGIERKQGSCSILNCDRIKREITVKERAGIHPFTKTYNFDHVFAQDSEQIEVYKAVVKPVVEEVLSGYNCTIFAYGQTGTGKTFTMEGERSETSLSWDADPKMGIIPRALHQIFTDLQQQTEIEFSVRVSFLELYNEELFDLLGSSSDPLRLRIYEDNTKKGSVIINGLEDVVVRNKDEVYEILQRGTARRQTAATLMNAVSSRSHSVFSVTIHIKENTIEGEELLKTGKLYLVDLAGSENIGRSGAIEKRAREAGNINQSLLTLGRVITALVEHAPHIPYRESKLTRLLQDSLGGRTKTSIIATISPASINLEETLSTLDYAFRAKNITNRPEVNQKLTKKALLREYNEEIERLRRDLVASREKNGIYVAEENYINMQNQITQQTDAIQELEDKITHTTEELTKLTELFTTTQEALKETSEKLVETSQALVETTDNLKRTDEELKVTKQDRDEQVFLVEEHVKTESVLYSQADQLLSTATSSVSDVGELHDKIDRKKAVEEHNEATIASCLNTFNSSFNEIRENVSNFKSQVDVQSKDSHRLIDTMFEETVSQMEQFRDKISEVKQSVQGEIDHCRKTESSVFNKSKESISSHLELFLSSQDKEKQQTEIQKEKVIANVKALEDLHLKSIKQFEHMVQTMRTQRDEMTNLISNLHCQMTMKINQMEEKTIKFVEEQAQHNKKLKETFETAKDVNKSRKKVFMDQMMQFFKMAEEDEDNLSKTVDLEIQLSNDDGNRLQSEISSCRKECSTTLTDMTKAQELTASYTSSNIEFVEEAKDISTKTLAISTETENSQIVFAKEALQRFKQSEETEKDKMSELSAINEEYHQVLKTTTENVLSVLENKTEESKQHLDDSSAKLTEKTVILKEQVEEHKNLNQKDLSQMDENIQGGVQLVHRILQEETKQDVPTGRTPQRCVFQYPRSLTKTDDHVTLLEQFRSSRRMSDPDKMKQDGSGIEGNSIGASVEDLRKSQGNVSEAGSEISVKSIGSTSGVSTTSQRSMISDFESSKENKGKTMGPPSSLNKKTKFTSKLQSTNSSKTPTKVPSGSIPRKKLPLRSNNPSS